MCSESGSVVFNCCTTCLFRSLQMTVANLRNESNKSCSKTKNCIDTFNFLGIEKKGIYIIYCKYIHFFSFGIDLIINRLKDTMDIAL